MSVPARRSGLFGTEGLSKEPPSGFERITEGSAAVLFPPALVKRRTLEAADTSNEYDEKMNNDDDGQAVFYNPAQVVNRDLSICAIECFSRIRRDEPRRKGGTREGITILEALSATGLRAIRYFKEITGVRYIVANDLDTDAVECIRRNCEFNGVPCLRPTETENFPSDSIHLDETTGLIESGGGVVPNHDDANDLMFRLAANPSVYGARRLCALRDGAVEPLLQQELMDVVDLDPYGSASPFLDAAMRCIKEGGMMIVTSTDSPILCGNYPDTCHAKYNTIPVKNAACHEMAVRILLAALERVANKHSKYIVPLISLHIDFYVRCFIRVYTQPAEVKLSPCKLGYVLHCTRCPAFWVRPMATVRPQRMRSTKRGRAAGTKGPNKNIPMNNLNHEGHVVEDSEEDATNTTATATATAEHQPLFSEKNGRESYPAAPLRQQNPQLSCCNLQSFPPLTHGRCCPACGGFVTLSGPIYAAPTQCRAFIEDVLLEVESRGAEKRISSEARVAGLLRAARDELPDTPLFALLPDIASHVRVRCPPTPLFVGALARLGYRCSQVHCAPAGIKTDCPPEVLLGVMLQWKCLQDAVDKESGVEGESKKKKHAEDNSRVTLVAPLVEADFSYDKQFDYRSSSTGVPKFIPNAPNWGPKRRHQGALSEDKGTEGV